MISFLKADPTDSGIEAIKLHSEILKRWQYWHLHGLKDEELEKFLKKYPRLPGLAAPKLNDEVLAIMWKAAEERDKYNKDRQEYADTALTAIGDKCSY